MLLSLNGLNSEKGEPNENFAREMMELFTLGHGSGYTERDVREQARALKGFTADYKSGVGWVKFRFDHARHDDAMKVVFGKASPFNWKQAPEAGLQVRAHVEHVSQRPDPRMRDPQVRRRAVLPEPVLAGQPRGQGWRRTRLTLLAEAFTC